MFGVRESLTRMRDARKVEARARSVLNFDIAVLPQKN